MRQAGGGARALRPTSLFTLRESKPGMAKTGVRSSGCTPREWGLRSRAPPPACGKGGVFCLHHRSASGAGGRAMRAQAPFARGAACAPHTGLRHIPPPPRNITSEVSRRTHGPAACPRPSRRSTVPARHRGRRQWRPWRASTDGNAAMSVNTRTAPASRKACAAAVAELARVVAEHRGARRHACGDAGDGVLDHGAARRVDAQRVGRGQVDIGERLAARRFVAAEDAPFEGSRAGRPCRAAAAPCRGRRPRRRRCGRPACRTARAPRPARRGSRPVRDRARRCGAPRTLQPFGRDREAGVGLDQRRFVLHGLAGEQAHRFFGA